MDIAQLTEFNQKVMIKYLGNNKEAYFIEWSSARKPLVNMFSKFFHGHGITCTNLLRPEDLLRKEIGPFDGLLNHKLNVDQVISFKALGCLLNSLNISFLLISHVRRKIENGLRWCRAFLFLFEFKFTCSLSVL
jgi:hypothetical protein